MDSNFQPQSNQPFQPNGPVENFNAQPTLPDSPSLNPPTSPQPMSYNPTTPAEPMTTGAPSLIQPTFQNPSPQNPSPSLPQPSDAIPPPNPQFQSFSSLPPIEPNNTLPPVYSGTVISPSSGGVFKPPKPRRSKLKLIGLTSLLVLVFGGMAAAGYFGVILPNKPENIWSKSLVNMGKAYDKMVSVTSDLQTNTKGIKLTGSFTAEGAFDGSGTIDSTSYNSDSDLKTGIKLKQGTINIEARSIAVDGSNFPDFYFNVKGIKTIVGNQPDYEPIIKVIDGQWISITHDYLQKFADAEGASFGRQQSDSKITSQDIIEVEKAVGTASKKWLFTADRSKQVLQIKQKIGKEKQDGRNVYHFKAEINKSNLKSYYKALRDEISKTKLGKTYTNAETNSDSNIDKEIDAADMPSNIEVWVDTHTKLIHKLRVSDSQSEVTFGQDYQGGSKVPFSIEGNDKTTGNPQTFNLKGMMDLDAKKLDLSLQVDADGQKLSGQITVSQNTEPVKVERPAKAKTIEEIMNLIFGMSLTPSSGSTPSGSIQSKAKDTERQTDLKAMASHLEVYNAQNGYYPTFSNLNNQTWVAANLKGLDKEAFKDPDGSVYSLAAGPAVHVYAYSVSPSGCNNAVGKACTSFVLTATYSDGSKYTVKSLDN